MFDEEKVRLCDACHVAKCKVSNGHFCEGTNQFICLSCYKSGNHDMYCPDPTTPLRTYPVSVHAHCAEFGHHYNHIKVSGRVILYCNRCVKVLSVDIEKTDMKYHHNRCLSHYHKYQHVQESGHVFLYCRKCATQVTL